MPDKLEKLHILLSIVAALVVTIISIVQNVSLYRMSIWVSVAIVVFFVIGHMLRIFLDNRTARKEENEPSAEEAPGALNDPAEVLTGESSDYDSDDD